MATEHENTVGYYTNWPDRTKREAEMIWAAIPDDEKEYPAIAAKEPVPNPIYTTTFDDDLLPEPEEPHAVSDEWRELSAIVDGIDCLEAYKRWIGKQPIKGTKGEVKIRCPLPDHEDKHPSATLNINEGLWHCHACQIGGDKFHLAAIHFGYDFNDIHGPSFADLKIAMAEDLGWQSAGLGPKGEPRFVKPGTAERIIEQLEQAPQPPPEPKSTDDDEVTFDWREVIKDVQSPLYEWMHQMAPTDLPDEFLFFTGLQMMAMAGGRDIYIDSVPEIYPSLYMLLIGPTSAGKSRCCEMVSRSLAAALPFDASSDEPDGVLISGKPASGEALVTVLSPPVEAVDDDGKPLAARRVKAWIRIDEFSEIAQRSKRTGDITEAVLMQLHDTPPALTITRAKRSDASEALEPFACVISTVQPAVLNHYVQSSDVHSGYANRWLPIMTTKLKRQQVVHRHRPDLDTFHQRLTDRQRWARDPRTNGAITFTSEAAEQWEQFFQENITPLKSNEHDPLSSMWGRIELHLQKIMLCFCINEKRTVIDEDLLWRVLALWPYISRTENRTITRIEVDEKEDYIERMREVLREHAQPIELDAEHTELAMKLSDFNQALTRHRRISTHAYNAALKQLEEKGEAFRLTVKTKRGRPPTFVVWRPDTD